MSEPIPFRRELEFEYGRMERVAPGIRRVIANNPSPFTFHGTGTYVIGEGDVAVIDPGPDDEAHIAAILQGLEGERITHILITHTHRDHSPGARLLKAATGARIYGFGPHGGGREEVQVEEGGDHDFVPDVTLTDGEFVHGAKWTVEAVHTPGHLSNHLCFAYAEERALFTGDHVMGWSTTVVSPPDGDMQAYMTSLEKVLARDDEVLWPTHGPPVTDPKPFIRALIAHRHERIAEILKTLRDGPKTIPEMVAAIYRDVPAYLHGAAGRSVLAHLIQLRAEGRVRAEGETLETARFERL